ncbi:hypothetical protein [Ruegeria arenilitoris]|nr:hypothetical protein [Ruegeria arenilitoris]
MTHPKKGLVQAFTLVLTFTAGLSSAAAENSAPPIKDAGVLAFSPDGTLFVGDSVSGAIYSYELAQTQPAAGGMVQDIDDKDVKISGLLGVGPNDISINDLAVHPVSKEVFVSITRGHGTRARRRHSSRASLQVPMPLQVAQTLVQLP